MYGQYITEPIIHKLVHHKVSIGIQGEDPKEHLITRGLLTTVLNEETPESTTGQSDSYVDLKNWNHSIKETMPWKDMVDGTVKEELKENTKRKTEIKESERIKDKDHYSILNKGGRLGAKAEEGGEEEQKVIGSLEKPEKQGEYIVYLPNINLPCPVCRDFFGKVSQLKLHLEVKHRKMIILYTCSLRGRNDKRPHSILVHIAKCKREDTTKNFAKNFRCSECHTDFNTRSDLSQHETCQPTAKK